MSNTLPKDVATTPATHKHGKLFSLTKRACKAISDETPIFLPYTDHGMSKLMCHLNVDKLVQAHGGEAVYGWIIWQSATNFINAEFHSVWRNPAGELLDVTPRVDGEDLILFLPDPKRSFDWQHKVTFSNMGWYPKLHSWFNMGELDETAPLHRDRFNRLHGDHTRSFVMNAELHDYAATRHL